MQYKRLKLSFLLLLSLGLTGLQAQESVNSGNGIVSGIMGTAEYSIGQSTYSTYLGINGSIAEGVFQPYEISIVTGLEKANDLDLMISAYPNPTLDNLTLNTSQFDISNLSYRIYDMNGKLLKTENIKTDRTNISLCNFQPSIYYIEIMQNNTIIKTFRIIKN